MLSVSGRFHEVMHVSGLMSGRHQDEKQARKWGLNTDPESYENPDINVTKGMMKVARWTMRERYVLFTSRNAM